MRFGVLGPVTAWTDAGEPVTIQGLKVRALLADLLVHEGRPVPADRLIDDLWGSQLPGNPAGTLSAKVSQLRRAFEDAEPGSRALVQSGPAGYSLAVDSSSYDALTFAERVAAGQFGEALTLWRGPAYADFADEAFVETAVARLNEQRLTAVESWADASVEELAALVAEHPLRERLRASHMRALYRSGRQTEALESYEELRRLLADELGLDPSPELVSLHQSILTQELPSRRSNLPAQLTELIGRDEAVADVSSCLASTRLVTLTGPGGVGKTRLALATASAVADRFADGVVLVELAAVTPAALSVSSSLTDAVLAALDVREIAGTPETVADRLAAVMGSRLLVLDNCEQVVSEVAELTDRLLAAAPGLRVLATSREPLGLAGEVVWSVPTLDVPARDDELDAASTCSSVQLFVARASAASRDFTLSAETLADVSVLCRRLDGIPLALELAATRVRALGVRGLVARLDDRFRLLATGHRGAAPRQQTLLAMIDWSWELLSPDEQVVLRRLAVHADGCTPEAAAAVCEADVLDVLVRLVDRSLVVPVHGVQGTRYRLLESVAAYCVEKLRAAGELESVQQRHLEYYTSFAEEARPHLYGGEQGRWLQLLDEDAANLRSAFDRAVATEQVELAERLVDALAWYWYLRGRIAEALRSLEAVPGSARAGAWRAGFMYVQGDSDAVRVRDQWLQSADARGQWWIAFAGSDVGDLVTCQALLEAALKSFEVDGDQWGVAAVLVARAKHAHVRSDVTALYADAFESARIFRALGDRWGVLQATSWLSAHAELIGDFDEAARLQREGIQLAEELGLWPELAGSLGMLGWTEIRQGNYEAARAHGERALRLATEQDQRSTQALAEIVLAYAARRTGALDEAEARLRALVEAARRQQDPVLYLSMVLTEFAYVLELRGQPDAALELHLEAFRISEEYESLRGMCWSLEGIAACLPDKTVAAKLLGAAHATRSAEGYLVTPAESGDTDRAVAAARAALGDAFELAWDAGAALSPEQAFRLL
jgi:predicted ATPase/DNA-binding SARP family transcriptional activator